MQKAAGPLETGPTIAAWARGALALTTGFPGVRRVGLALAEGGGRRLRFTASDAGMEWCHVDAYDDVPLNTAVATGRPVLGALHDLDKRYARFVENQRGTPTVAVAAVPITMAGRTVGAYVMFFDRPQPFDRAQHRELCRIGEELGARLMLALESHRRREVAGADEPPGAFAAVHEVPPEPRGVAEARRFLRNTLHDWAVDEETTDTAVLCLSELVTNAVIHTHAGCVLRVQLEDGILTTTVRDAGARHAAPDDQLDDPLRVHGRGLQLVDALAHRWGSDPDPVGTTVWFALEV